MAEAVTINDTADEIKVTNCNHNADDSKKVGRYTFGNDEFNLESAYHDCKLVFDGITDDDSFQEADTGLILYYANEIIYALHEALQGKDTNVPSKDVIYRQDVTDALDRRFAEHIKQFDYDSYEKADEKTQLVCDGIIDAINAVLGLPSAQLKRTEERTETHACENTCEIERKSNDMISRQEAIDIVVFECGKWTGLAKEISKQLKRLPSAQPTYTDEQIQKMQDLESAEIEKAYQLGYEEGKRNTQPDFDMTEKIDKAHDDGYEQGYLQGKADYERKTGKWRRRLVDSGFNADWHCSECGWKTSIEEHGYNYCPNCGADMRGEQDD